MSDDIKKLETAAYQRGYVAGKKSMAPSIKPCAHASYCPLRMRDGDRPGCNIAIHRGDCQPVVDRQAEVFREFPARSVDVHEVFLRNRNKSFD